MACNAIRAIRPAHASLSTQNRLSKTSTGLCDPESKFPGHVQDEGTMRFAYAVDLIESFRKGSGGGISEDSFSDLGEPDVTKMAMVRRILFQFKSTSI